MIYAHQYWSADTVKCDPIRHAKDCALRAKLLLQLVLYHHHCSYFSITIHVSLLPSMVRSVFGEDYNLLQCNCADRVDNFLQFVPDLRNTLSLLSVEQHHKSSIRCNWFGKFIILASILQISIFFALFTRTIHAEFFSAHFFRLKIDFFECSSLVVHTTEVAYCIYNCIRCTD